MKKVLIGGLVVFLLTGCVNSNNDKKDIDVIFREEIIAVSEIADLKGKNLVSEISIEEIEEIFNGIFNLAIFESSSLEYGEVTQGTGSDGNGGRVFCSKLPVNVTFTGSKASIDRFIEYFEELDIVVSFGDFKIFELEDEKYKVATVVNFLGKDVGETLTTGKKEYTIKKNEVEVDENELVLRDFDVSMIIRPSNSDSSAISLGVVEGGDYRIYSDENSRHTVDVKFSNEGSNYFCEYSIDGKDITKANIKVSGSILFDIFSCELIEEDDEILVDLYITNNSNKKISTIIYDDDNKRVNVANKVGNVEVKKQ